MTVLEVLANAQFNLNSRFEFQTLIGKQQLDNAIAQLEEDGDADKEFIEKEEV